MSALTGVANDLLGDGKSRARKNFRSYVDQSSSHVRSVVKPQQPAPTNQPTKLTDTHTHTHTRLTALFQGLPGWASTRKVKPIWILMKQETVSSSGISCVICKSAPRSRHITTPAPHHSFFIGRMPFLSPNQQCQSTEGINLLNIHIFTTQSSCVTGLPPPSHADRVSQFGRVRPRWSQRSNGTPKENG